jgi:hypothetical protein
MSGVGVQESATGMRPNPFPELQPGGSFMNVLLAADWVAGQLSLDGLSPAERQALIKSHVALVTRMRTLASNLSSIELPITKEWLDRAWAVSSQIGQPEGVVDDGH